MSEPSMRSDRSIRRALMWITMVTSCGAVLLATAITLANGYLRTQDSVEQSLDVLAQVIGLNAGSALVFDDSATAEETLSALSAEPHVVAGVIYTISGGVFASYVREGVDDFVTPARPTVGPPEWSAESLDLAREIVIGRERVGTVFIRSDVEEVNSVLREFGLIGLLVLGIATVVSWTGATWLRGRIATPLAALADGSERMASGDLSSRVALDNHDDELGTLAHRFNAMAESLAGLVSRVRSNTRSVSEVTQRLQEATHGMHEGASRQQLAVDETGESIEHMTQGIGLVNTNVESLSETATETSASALQMDTAIQGIAAHVDELSVTIDQVASSVVEMTSAIGEIARSADTLNDATVSTSDSLHLLNRSVTEVEESAQQSQTLAEKSTEHAEQGVRAVQQTVQGMMLIQSSFQGLEQIIGRLEEKSQSIGEVIKVIEGVVEQTNLLALNAAIISSHAGEHGRAFAVVAQEVKSLADRTAGSTREIASLIEGVQSEVGDAVSAMSQGGERVDAGVALSNQAGEILQAIGGSAKESTQMANDIVRSTGSQASDIKRVEEAMEQVRNIAKQLNRGTHEQDSASAEITRGVERMRELSQDVKRSTQEQRRESQHITQSVEVVAARISDILASTKDQSKQAEQILQALQVFREVTDQSTERAEEMKQTVSILAARSEELNEEVGLFNL